MIIFTTESTDLIFNILKQTNDFENAEIFFDDSKTLRKVTNFESITELFECNGTLEEHVTKYLLTLSDNVKLTIRTDGKSMSVDNINIETKRKDYGINIAASKYMF
ncbi:hypothetical protein [Moritella dasanensis]|uniref:hypothetical protein n=1 Tax=Moritella dasanensis TaxID=428031 RepID=UPI00030ACC04|nr:hypothetical protein [Moritella dasanensis]